MAYFRRNLRVGVAALGVLVLAACGGDDGAGDGAADGEVRPGGPAPAATPGRGGRAPEVRMVTTRGGEAGVFEPAQVTARVGDTVRFISDGGTAHNASFLPEDNASATGLPGAGPLLTQEGQTYDVPITFGPGTYNFKCDMHAEQGMTGTLTVTQ